MIRMEGQAILPQIVLALGTPGRFAPALHGGEQQRNQHSDNCHHDEELDQRETQLLTSILSTLSMADSVMARA